MVTNCITKCYYSSGSVFCCLDIYNLNLMISGWNSLDLASHVYVHSKIPKVRSIFSSCINHWLIHNVKDILQTLRLLFLCLLLSNLSLVTCSSFNISLDISHISWNITHWKSKTVADILNVKFLMEEALYYSWGHGWEVANDYSNHISLSFSETSHYSCFTLRYSVFIFDLYFLSEVYSSQESGLWSILQGKFNFKVCKHWVDIHWEKIDCLDGHIFNVNVMLNHLKGC